jgi:hypothetical protein
MYLIPSRVIAGRVRIGLNKYSQYIVRQRWRFHEMLGACCLKATSGSVGLRQRSGHSRFGWPGGLETLGT